MAIQHRRKTPESVPVLPRTKKPLSTDKVVSSNGLRYTREDQLDYVKMAKTVLVTLLVAVSVGYLFLKSYRLIWDFAVDYYLFYEELDRVQYAMDALLLFIEGVIAYYAAVFLNRKLLLQYSDQDELDHYN